MCEERINEEIERLGRSEVLDGSEEGSSSASASEPTPGAQRKRRHLEAFGSFWEGGVSALESRTPRAREEVREEDGMDGDADGGAQGQRADVFDEDEWEKEVVSALEGLQSVPALEGSVFLLFGL